MRHDRRRLFHRTLGREGRSNHQEVSAMRIIALSLALLLGGCSTSANWSTPVAPPAPAVVRKAAPVKTAAAPARVEAVAPSAAPAAPSAPTIAAQPQKEKRWKWRLRLL